MQSPQKKRRLVLSVRKSSMWSEILDVWTKIHKFPTSEDAETRVYSRFVLFNKTPRETIVDVRPIESRGNHSKMYEIILNGILQNVIMKVFHSTDSRNVSPIIEAHMQHYASVHGFAPPVFAFNKMAMISAKCEKPIDIKPLDDGYVWHKVLTKDIHARDMRKRISTLNNALGSGPQSVLQLAKRMFEKIGMFNMDPNIDNYMMYKGSLVQVDFGMNRFCNRNAFQKFKMACPHQEVQKAFETVAPTSPPDFYWYQTYVANGHQNAFDWQREDWASYHMSMPVERANTIRAVENKRVQLQKCAEKKETKAKYKTYTKNNCS
mgnify:CR=1 FL=1